MTTNDQLLWQAGSSGATSRAQVLLPDLQVQMLGFELYFFFLHIIGMPYSQALYTILFLILSKKHLENFQNEFPNY